MGRKNVLILFGGCSPEHDVSLHSAAAVVERLDRDRYEPVLVGITREGRWLRYEGAADAIASGRWQQDAARCRPAALSPDRTRRALIVEGGAPIPLDAAFPVLHGRYGEDGCAQGILETAGIPVVGCGVLASALCMDKQRAHALARQAGVLAPEGVRFDAPPHAAQALAAVRSLGYPLFVKPVRAGSSFGVSRVDAPEQLCGAIRDAFAYDGSVLVERAVQGVEVGCAIMGDRELTIGAIDEVELCGDYYSYEEKYTPRDTRIHLPARVDAETEARIRRTAVRLYRALGCSGFARVDMFLAPNGLLWFNEINTIPGFTAHSRFPAMMGAAGIPFDRLVNRLVEQALEGGEARCNG